MPPNPSPVPRPPSPVRGDVELLERLGAARSDLLAQVGRRIVGQRDVLVGILTAVFSGGHALLLGVPGLAKTLMVQTLAQTLDLKFTRIQFTPDLMPSDITGTEIIEEDQSTGKRGFRFVRGPVFANIVLADEVNRTPPKTQAALLQAMQEHLVRRIPVPKPLVRAAVTLVRMTRPPDDAAPPFIKQYVSWGAGPRASQYLILGAKARAALDGRPMPDEDDLRAVASTVLTHRLVINFAAEAARRAEPDLVQELLVTKTWLQG